MKVKQLILCVSAFITASQLSQVHAALELVYSGDPTSLFSVTDIEGNFSYPDIEFSADLAPIKMDIVYNSVTHLWPGLFEFGISVFDPSEVIISNPVLDPLGTGAFVEADFILYSFNPSISGESRFYEGFTFLADYTGAPIAPDTVIASFDLIAGRSLAPVDDDPFPGIGIVDFPFPPPQGSASDIALVSGTGFFGSSRPEPILDHLLATEVLPFAQQEFDVQVVPEPSTYAAILGTIIGLLAFCRRQSA